MTHTTHMPHMDAPSGATLQNGQYNENPLSQLATSLAHKCVSHGRVYAVLFLNKPQRAAMLQATSGMGGLRLRSEGEAHWSRLVFEPHRPSPMPQKSRIVLNKEARTLPSLRALAGRG
ncbi:MAG: hypothetical protein FWB81_08180 [Cystobacterineae bacterium]|nr:hypothetical protein [Cystobacterineae bacterium]